MRSDPAPVSIASGEKERKTPLVEVLKKKMKIGPIPVAEYMSTVLADPDVCVSRMNCVDEPLVRRWE